MIVIKKEQEPRLTPQTRDTLGGACGGVAIGALFLAGPFAPFVAAGTGVACALTYYGEYRNSQNVENGMANLISIELDFAGVGNEARSMQKRVLADISQWNIAKLQIKEVLSFGQGLIKSGAKGLARITSQYADQLHAVMGSVVNVQGIASGLKVPDASLSNSFLALAAIIILLSIFGMIYYSRKMFKRRRD